MVGEWIETPYGRFAADFCVDRLANLCDPIAGIQTGPFGSQLHQKDYVEVGTPIITVEHLGENRILHENTPKVSNKDRNRLSRYLLKKGDIVFSRVGSVDRRALVREEEDGWLFSGRCLRVRPDPAKIDSQYLSYFFGLPAFKEYIRSIAVGATMPSLNTALLSDVVVPHSKDVKEQRAIAHILGTLDDKIELNRRRNQTLEAMARALFKDWFVDFGPVRAKMEGREPYLPADLWQLFPDRLDEEGKPEGWSEQPLDEIADFLNGLALQKFRAIDPSDSLPVIKIAELRNGVSAKSDRASREVPAKYIIRDGDFLFSWSGSLLAKFWTEGEGALNQHLFKVTSESYPMWFVSHWVHHHLEEFQAIAASKATTMGHIQRGHLKAAMTLCPPEHVLERLGVVMAPLVEQSIHNELESRRLAQLRDTLLPKLISGELRIADAEKFLERQV